MAKQNRTDLLVKKEYEGEYPRADKDETYREYKARVDECVKQGFSLKYLGNFDWTCYCRGSGVYAGVDSDNNIPS